MPMGDSPITSRVATIKVAVLPKLIGQCRVSPNVDPVVLFGRHVAGYTLNLEILCDGLRWVLRFEQGPAPAPAPELVALETAFGVLDHDEPAFGLGDVADLAGGHTIGPSLEQFLHQHCAVRELPGHSQHQLMSP